MTHVAPFRQIFTVVHLVDPQRRPVSKAPSRGGDLTSDSNTGYTICGQPMLISDAWIEYVPSPHDKVCGRCAGENHIEEAMLL